LGHSTLREAAKQFQFLIGRLITKSSQYSGTKLKSSFNSS